MDTVDSYIPDPQRDTDKPFLMPVEDVFTKMCIRDRLITDEERYKEVIETWKDTDDALTKALLTGLDKYNNILSLIHI